jgi:hypothetical protein
MLGLTRDPTESRPETIMAAVTLTVRCAVSLGSTSSTAPSARFLLAGRRTALRMHPDAACVIQDRLGLTLVNGSTTAEGGRSAAMPATTSLRTQRATDKLRRESG